MYLSRIPDIRGQLSQVKFPSTVLPFNTTTQPLKLIIICAGITVAKRMFSPFLRPFGPFLAGGGGGSESESDLDPDWDSDPETGRPGLLVFWIAPGGLLIWLGAWFWIRARWGLLKLYNKECKIKQECNYRWQQVNEVVSPSSCLCLLAFCRLDRPTPSVVRSPRDHISNLLILMCILLITQHFWVVMKLWDVWANFRREYLVAVFAGVRVRAGWWFGFWGRSTLLSISITGWCPCSLHWWPLQSFT